MFYKVKVLIWDIITKNNKLVDYSLSTAKKIGFSSRVLVKYLQFSQVNGYVFSYEINDTLDKSLIPVIKVIDDFPLLEEEKDLVIHASSYYKTSIYEVLKIILPFVSKEIETRVLFYKAVVPPPGAKLNKTEYDLYQKIKKEKEVCESDIKNLAVAEHLLELGFLKSELKEPLLRSADINFLDYNFDSFSNDIIQRIRSSDKDVILKISDNKKKFEIYAELIKERINNNQSVLLLCKSIERDSMQITFLNQMFKEKIYIIDKHISEANRVKMLNELRQVDCALVVGLPEAIFYHLNNLSLIIVDVAEAREYKMNNYPYLNFRNLAGEKLDNGRVIYSCYSPSVSFMARANRGYLSYLELEEKRRSFELIRRDEDNIFPEALLKEIETCLKNNKQVLIYHSTRGYAPIYKCRICSSVASCPTCGVPLTYYKDEDYIVCMRCGYKQRLEEYRCDRCGGDRFEAKGYGTMKIVEYLKERFSSYKISRLDNDSYREHEYQNELSSFAMGYSSILVGSQLVSSNLYLPKVDLLIIMDLDWILNRGEYNIEERSFNLLSSLSSQVSSLGKCFIISSFPDNESLKLIARQDYQSFYNHAIVKRKILHDPPYYYIVNVEIIGEDKSRVDDIGISLSGMIKKELLHTKTLVVGPSPVKFLGSNKRFKTIICIKYKVRDEIESLLEKLLSLVVPKDLSLNINIDPLSD